LDTFPQPKFSSKTDIPSPTDLSRYINSPIEGWERSIAGSINLPLVDGRWASIELRDKKSIPSESSGKLFPDGCITLSVKILNKNPVSVGPQRGKPPSRS
jgi:hypothetical protein